jgi:hypothetical protein
MLWAKCLRENCARLTSNANSLFNGCYEFPVQCPRLCYFFDREMVKTVSAVDRVGKLSTF